jgi:hypothetical protein
MPHHHDDIYIPRHDPSLAGSYSGRRLLKAQAGGGPAGLGGLRRGLPVCVSASGTASVTVCVTVCVSVPDSVAMEVTVTPGAVTVAGAEEDCGGTRVAAASRAVIPAGGRTRTGLLLLLLLLPTVEVEEGGRGHWRALELELEVLA